VPFRYGFILNAGRTAESIVEVAVAAEEHGWDGLFIADAIGIETKDFPAFPFFDPWVLMGAMAARTRRLTLGTMLTAVPRRRPWKLAREVVTLDHLSNGRVILGTGVGAAQDDGGFYKVGEAMDLPTRAARLDEGLQIIAGLMTGKPFSFDGVHFKVDAMTLLPPPVQKPRVPLWVVGVWPKPRSMARALRWDGLIPQPPTPAKGYPEPFSPEVYREIKAYVDEHRKTDGPFDIPASGTTSGAKKDQSKARDQVRAYAAAGATWWLEASFSFDTKAPLKRIRQGPPRLD
jgi:alkanesulfonate monooxygenase SsuD/methylene tetrahydromethanopterin reductase-like flavin-dependent oxidoreductase (luciferase family)